MRALLIALLYGIFFILIEYIAGKAKLPKETSRKIVHIIAGCTAALLPLVMPFHQIAILGALFIPAMFLSKRLNVFSSIHKVERKTYGEVYFPVAIVLTALLFPTTYLYAYGLLVMAVSDGFASVIGQKYGHKTYKLLFSRKSYIGSLTFCISALVIGILALVCSNTANLVPAVLVSLLAAIVLTFVEAILSFGLDNLVLPPLAAFLLFSLVKLVV